MTRGFAWITAALTATVGLLVGMVVTGSLSPTPALSAPPVVARSAAANLAPAPLLGPIAIPGAVNFADIAERLNPVAGNIDASVPGKRGRAPSTDPRRRPDPLEDLPDERRPRSGDTPRRGTGTGFIIDEQGLILTNHHVIEGAERLTVKLADGRNLRASVVGSDPDTDIALIRVEAAGKLPAAVLGDSNHLRVGEWVVAIGNPLAYEHTVTVGVVSFIGRKLFDSSLDRYIQTDAAINFGNSGGPLINARGEVIGINAAISSRASNIGFAVPINQASAILPQLRETGRVSRGFIGVSLKDLDADLRRSLGLRAQAGALVEDVNAGSPAERARIRIYDVIVAVDGK